MEHRKKINTHFLYGGEENAVNLLNYINENLTDKLALAKSLLLNINLQNINNILQISSFSNSYKVLLIESFLILEVFLPLLNKIDEYIFTMGAVSLISDMMPLVSYNRDIVRLGLKFAKENHYPQIDLLLDKDGVKNEKSFSFVIAPKINSLGRVLEDRRVNTGLTYFVNNDINIIKESLKLIEYTNDHRKVISNEAIKKIDYKKYEDKIFIIDRFDDISEGLIGLIANRVLNEVNKPCIIFTKDKKTGYLKGSARSLEGLPLVTLFSELEDIIVQFGGHAMAGGIAIEEKNLDDFILRANEVAKKYTLKKKEKLIIECELDELNIENYELINSLSPYGEGFEEPYLSIKFPCKNISYLSNGKHIKGNVNFGCSFIAFNVKKDYGRVGEVTLIGRLTKDSYRGGNYLSLQVDEVIEC